MKFFVFFVVTIGMCVLLSRADAEVSDDEVLFKKLGSFQSPHTEIEKSYWVPRYFKAQWQFTRDICHAYGFDIVALESPEEADAVSKMCEVNRDLFGSYVHVGGVAKVGRSKTEWYWTKSNSKVSYAMTWQDGQPDFSGEQEWCLSLAKDARFKFNDISCSGSWEERFICEKVENEIDVKKKQVYLD